MENSEKPIDIERDLAATSSASAVEQPSQGIRKNMSVLDQRVRLTVGVLCLAVGLTKYELIGGPFIAALVVGFGMMNLGSAFVRHCPMYALADISTNKPSS